MVKMISCESEKDYEKYWADFNREIMDEPIMLKKFTKSFKMKYTMTPELREVWTKITKYFYFFLNCAHLAYLNRIDQTTMRVDASWQAWVWLIIMLRLKREEELHDCILASESLRTFFQLSALLHRSFFNQGADSKFRHFLRHKVHIFRKGSQVIRLQPNYSDTTVKLQLFFLAKKESNVIAFLTISQIVEQKELTIAEIENKKLQEQEAAELAAEKLAQKESESSPRKDKWQSILEIPEIASMSEKMIRHQLNRSAQAIV